MSSFKVLRSPSLLGLVVYGKLMMDTILLGIEHVNLGLLLISFLLCDYRIFKFRSMRWRAGRLFEKSRAYVLRASSSSPSHPVANISWANVE